ncbi:hypothetical protein QYM36_018118 [Artemia franciscana]|uniref:Uncharacterized protein n=1 Tax=Artemia franciscana TaxID=6661 RepID=A0AA88HDQ3_ARTSF|nr:hypothetical protein QYM36_018118 [Artemia franciscana]
MTSRISIAKDKDPSEPQTEKHADVERIEAWADAWLVSLNASKRKELLVSKVRCMEAHPDVIFKGEAITIKSGLSSFLRGVIFTFSSLTSQKPLIVHGSTRKFFVKLKLMELMIDYLRCLLTLFVSDYCKLSSTASYQKST